MNDVALFAGIAIANVDDFDKSLDQGLAKAPQVAENTAFLKLNQKSGTFTYGKDATEVEEGSEWAVNSMSLQHGYQNWSDPKVTKKKSELLGEMFVQYNVDLPPVRELEDHSVDGGVWKDAVKFGLACISGEDEGEQTTYSANSYGGCKAYKDIMTAIRNRPESEYMIPVVTLTTTSYESNFGETIYNPIFEVVDWSTPDGNRLKGGKATPEVEDKSEEVDDEAPTRRRRRAKAS